MEEMCERCFEPVDLEPFLHPAETLQPSGVEKAASGALLTPQGAVYCAGCAPDVRFCRECGCTDEIGCAEGCAWVDLADGTDNLCTACVGGERKD